MCGSRLKITDDLRNSEFCDVAQLIFERFGFLLTEWKRTLVVGCLSNHMRDLAGGKYLMPL